MASNLTSARGFIQADLDYARHVITLWSDQVSELEKALEQIDSVGSSRAALRGEYQEHWGRGPTLTAGNEAKVKAKRGRKPKLIGAARDVEVVKPRKRRGVQSSARSIGANAAGLDGSATGQPGTAVKKRTQTKSALSGVAKYRDPNSGKTWTGHGRRPHWMIGALDTFLIKAEAGPQAPNTAL